jgi:hypothetical protein
MPRQRHPIKELETVLRDAEARGWRVERGGYFMMKCPCTERHMKTVHLTPSNPNYERNLRAWLARCSCWKDG